MYFQVRERLKALNPNTVNTDLLPNTFALGYENIKEFLSDVHKGGSESIDFDYEHASWLLVGAVIVNEIRAAVFEETGKIKVACTKAFTQPKCKWE